MEFKLQDFVTPMVVSRIANVHYFEFTTQYQSVDDSHDFCELLYVDKGSICVYADNYSGILSDGQLIIHRAGETHSLQCNENIFPHVIIIGFECAAKELELFSQAPVTLPPMHRRMLADVLKEGMNLFAPPYDIPNTLEMKKRAEYPFASDQMLKLNLELFLITLVRDHAQLTSSPGEESMDDARLADICKYITEHYTEKILLDNICFLFGTNKTSLCQRFRLEYGTTILNYIDQLKVKDAKKLLREQKLSVTEISDRLGFSSIHYFCRHFKKHTGMSPKEYQTRKLISASTSDTLSVTSQTSP